MANQAGGRPRQPPQPPPPSQPPRAGGATAGVAGAADAQGAAGGRGGGGPPPAPGGPRAADRRALERALEAVPRHPAPAPELEQYRTPPAIAADLLWRAAQDGCIQDRNVLDLGCGTGMFALGAALLGARLAAGVDADAASIALATQAAAQAGVAASTWFVAARVEAWRPDAGVFDTVVMNPPFGAQKGGRHADRAFYEAAAAAVGDRPGGTAWFLAQARTERFLEGMAGRLGARIEKVAAWEYPLEAQFAFHASAVRAVGVGGYRMAWR